MSSPLPADGRPGRGHDVYRVVGGSPAMSSAGWTGLREPNASR